MHGLHIEKTAQISAAACVFVPPFVTTFNGNAPCAALRGLGK